jgi:hypothetical protein
MERLNDPSFVKMRKKFRSLLQRVPDLSKIEEGLYVKVSKIVNSFAELSELAH